MTSLLSAISGHFNRALIFGTVVPVVTFVLIGMWLLESWLPASPPWHRLAAWGGEWQAAAAFLVVAMITGLLHSINVPLTRMYEGYPWEDTAIGKWRAARYREEYDELVARWRGYRTLRYAIEDDQTLAAVAGTTAQREALSDEHARIGRALADSFPQRASILPTRLGNAIRAFENYPRHQYGMSAVPLWPRLVAVIDAEYAAAISEQKTSFDFMVNCSALAFISAAMLFVLGLAVPVPFVSPGWMMLWIAEVAAFAAVGWLTYEGSIGRAVAWGQMVKGAFDLYRHELLRHLGYTTMPATMGEERRIWNLISQQIIFGTTRRVLPPPYAASFTYVEADPQWLAIGVHRNVEAPGAAGTQRVHLRVKNHDPSKRAARKVIVVEKLEANTEFVHGSVLPAGIEVDGVNPVRFDAGALDAGATADVSFEIVRYKT